jgi:hypothetical protein
MALLKCVNGKILQIGCNHGGNASIEKKVPANKNCGKVIIFANGGIVLSFLATLLTIKPKPIKRINAKKLNNMISIKVWNPCTNVKLNAKWPTPITIMAVNI